MQPNRRRLWSWLHLLVALVAAFSAVYFFLFPGVTVARALGDDGLKGPGIASVAWRLHRDLTPRFTVWARERIASGRAAHVALHDVPTTEWPIFTAVFYLMATDALETAWEKGDHTAGEAPARYATEAITAARDLVMDPSHHTWVKTHWGEGYMHRSNMFFRSLVVAALSSYEHLTHDGTGLPVLVDQVDTLAASLDASPLGVLEDYPGECYPIDVLAGIGMMRHADTVTGREHGAFFERAARGFEGAMADANGLVPYRMDVQTGEHEQPPRGIGNSWVSVFAADVWPDRAKGWYARYEAAFWQDHAWAAGFREYAPGSPDGEWTTEVDAGPVLDGFGTSASAFGIAAARKNGRFDHAYVLSSEMLAVSWPLPGGTLLGPRALSHATDAPYLGEAGILYFLTVTPAAGVPLVTGGRLPGLVYGALAVYFGVTVVALSWLVGAARRVRRAYWTNEMRLKSMQVVELPVDETCTKNVTG